LPTIGLQVNRDIPKKKIEKRGGSNLEEIKRHKGVREAPSLIYMQEDM